MSSSIRYSVKSVFNPASYGLDGPHYAVVADLPSCFGGLRTVVDMVSEKELQDVGLDEKGLKEGFDHAAEMMLWEMTDLDGLKIEFRQTKPDGTVFTQNTMHLPARYGPLGLARAYHDWMAWRVRVGLWLEDRQSRTLSPAQEARFLRALEPQEVTQNREQAIPELTIAA